MKPVLRRTVDVDEVKYLHTRLFPGDYWEDSDAHWLILVETNRGTVKGGFCSARKIRGEPTVFLSRAGVFPWLSGRGLQRRMIRTRIKWAKKIGARYVVTYTTYDNHLSICNLIKCGFRFYVPEWKWAGPGVHYFMYEIE